MAETNPPDLTKRQIRLPSEAEGRLDRALATALGFGRAAVKTAFALGRVRMDGRRVRGSEPAQPGALIEIEIEEPGPPLPEPTAFTVLLESIRWLVAEKPAGMPTHPLAAGERHTLANAVVARYPECATASPEPREGGALQRLDLETSGCVLFARDRSAWDALRSQFAGRTIEKFYLALVSGRVSSGGVVSVPLAQMGRRVIPAPDPLSVERLHKKGASKARPAETHYTVVRPLPLHTLLEVRIVTGVMHQIRAHLADLGHPVVGDTLYGGEAAAVPGFERHFLHAARLGFERPEGGRVMVESALPPELELMLERCA